MPQTPPPDAPRVLVIGAGSRGTSYTKALVHPPSNVDPEEIVRGVVVGVAEPDDGKRKRFSEKYILCVDGEKLEFSDWREMVTEEGKQRIAKVGVDGIMVCEWMNLILRQSC